MECCQRQNREKLFVEVPEKHSGIYSCDENPKTSHWDSRNKKIEDLKGYHSNNQRSEITRYREPFNLYVSLPDERITEKPDVSARQAHSINFQTGRNPRYKVESRVIRARLDYEHAFTLRNKFGFPRSVIARALRLRFEEENDDFPTFQEFYEACVDVTRQIGLTPPVFDTRLTITRHGQIVLNSMKDDGTIVGEAGLSIDFTGSSTSSDSKVSPPPPGACWSCHKYEADHVTIPCGHCSLCKQCASQKIRHCIQCQREVNDVIKIFRS